MKFFFALVVLAIVILTATIVTHALTEKNHDRQDCEKLGGVFITARDAPHMCFAKEALIKVY